MNILASYRYQMADHKKAILIFYLVIIGLFVVSGLSSALVTTGAGESYTRSVNGNEMATVIFLFVIGLCTFKETFLLSLQNGVSRKTLFSAKIVTMLSVAAIMALVDKVIGLISLAALSLTSKGVIAVTFYEGLYPAQTANTSAFVIHLESFFFEFVLALAAMAVGYFITIMFYRLAKTGKVIVGAGVPVLCFMIIPWLDTHFFNGRLTMAFARFIVAAACTPFRVVLTSLAVFILFSALSYLLMRKAVVKR
ncbi:hypothetical protein NE619_12630 [Anaerovorax odorimutans]|uniref:ABC transporter permease n=1 Tax=Anaerovorax odorimutans TaxID=109327 RepID=A0ABT1RQW9_9FIRM|nr:hypothetical protein [Anaerovorax odorimutans]MCQ4637572.1 hypothetical protein [Anaerovorax odorimutans]